MTSSGHTSTSSMIQASPRTPQLYTRNQLFRIQAIHNILQANRFPNCAILAERLEVSSRTIRRDLEFMALHLMLPLEYDPKQRGYYYSSYVDGLNTQCFNAREVRALHMTLPTIRDQANLVVLSGLLKKICHLGGIQSPDIAV